MRTTTFYFIRHGEIDNPQQVYYGRSLDLHLSEEGREQVRITARILKDSGVEVDHIFTSPLSRGVETARIISGGFPSATLIQENDLTDVNIPSLVGKPIALRKKIHATGIDEYSGKYVEQGNESREKITGRMVRVFNKINREYGGKTIVIVGHGDPLRFLLYRLKNPEGSLPSIGELIHSYYPNKGEGWKMVVDEDGRILETAIITKEGTVKTEREL